jgi:hypothetical protein
MDEVRLALGWGALLPHHLRRMLAPESADDRAVAAAFTRLSSVGWTGAKASDKVDDPLPRVRFVDTVIVSDTPLEASVGVDLATTAVVDRALSLVPGAPGIATLVDEYPGAMRLRVHSPSRQLLVISESNHEGWRVLVDDQPAEILPVHGHLIGVVIEPGDHEVTLRFSPTSVRVGRRVSLVGLVGLLCWGAWEWLRDGADSPEGAA